MYDCLQLDGHKYAHISLMLTQILFIEICTMLLKKNEIGWRWNAMTTTRRSVLNATGLVLVLVDCCLSTDDAGSVMCNTIWVWGP